MKTRRDFLNRAAILAGGARFASTFLASIEKASSIDPPSGSTFLDAEHVVILMQENRSFDHCFGRLRGVRGFNDPRAVTLPDGKPVWLQTNAAGETFAPFRLDLKGTKVTWLGSLPHSWRDQTGARNHGNHDKWLDFKPSSNKECAAMPLTMGYYDREDIPFYYALADAFTVADQYFCSSLTGTTPNRLYLWTGTVREKQEAASVPCVRNSDVDYGVTARWKTFPERLEEAGISWRIYQNELSMDSGLNDEEDSWLSNFTDNPIEWFDQYHTGFSATYRRRLDHLATTLPAEIEQLRSSIASGSTKQHDLEAKEALLKKVTAERAKWTDEVFAKLSPHERNLHAKAFTTNSGDPFYRQLAVLRYRDKGEERSLAIPKGDVFHQFRQDVATGHLPAVSWLVAPEKFSDHPSAPWYGAWYVAQALDILTRNPDVWKKTIFILTYDENDGYFDHVPPFVAPDPDNPESGKTSRGVSASLDYLPLAQDLARQPAAEARGGPVGLGYRVPFVIASPWSRGGYVCSQVFDHTSILQLLEKLMSRRLGKPVEEKNISAWRRTVCGDLTSMFRPFQDADITRLPFPPKDEFLEGIHKAQFNPLPSGPVKLSAADAARWMPHQELGVRPSAALPYQLYTEGAVSPDGKLFHIVLEARSEMFGKTSAGSPFHVYTPGTFFGGTNRRTRAFAVAAGDRLTDSWQMEGFENNAYHLRVCGPNGFFREFAGGPDDPSLRIVCEYVRDTGNVEIQVASLRHDRDWNVHITDNAYQTGLLSMQVKAGGTQSMILDVSRSFHWYDFSVTVEGSEAFSRRYAGRVETGKPGFSDPAMA